MRVPSMITKIGSDYSDGEEFSTSVAVKHLRGLRPEIYDRRPLRRQRGVRCSFQPHRRAAMLNARRDKRRKQRMWRHGFGFEFRMELAAEKPRMVRRFHDFHVGSVRSLAGNLAIPRPSKSFRIRD